MLTQRFAALRAANRRALVCYVTAGHPDRARSLALLRGLADAGADVLEVGVPFSDPVADGPVIQGSSQRALEQGIFSVKSIQFRQYARGAGLHRIGGGHYEWSLRNDS